MGGWREALKLVVVDDRFKVVLLKRERWKMMGMTEQQADAELGVSARTCGSADDTWTAGLHWHPQYALPSRWMINLISDVLRATSTTSREMLELEAHKTATNCRYTVLR